MKVHELIAFLKVLPPDAVVVVNEITHSHGEVVSSRWSPIRETDIAVETAPDGHTFAAYIEREWQVDETTTDQIRERLDGRA